MDNRIPAISVNFPHAPNISHLLSHFVFSMLNRCMQKQELQHQIRKSETADTIEANKWISANGFDTNTFGSTHIRLLQAQQQAHQILMHYNNYITNEQRNTLEKFLHAMAHKNTRTKLNPKAATHILNISTKVNRHIFKQHRHINK